MLTISRPIIVEGKYDKIKVASVAHAGIVHNVVTLNDLFKE